jgi:hypothetical protein
MHEEIKSRLNLGNAFSHSVQNPLPSHQPSKNIKINILSCDRVTIDRVWIGNWIYWALTKLMTTPHKSLLHTNQCSESRCLVTASSGGRSSASGLMSLQAGDHLTPSSLLTNCQLRTPNCSPWQAHNSPQLSPTRLQRTAMSRLTPGSSWLLF